MVVDFLFFSSFLPLLLDSSSCLDFAPNTLLFFFYFRPRLIILSLISGPVYSLYGETMFSGG